MVGAAVLACALQLLGPGAALRIPEADRKEELGSPPLASEAPQALDLSSDDPADDPRWWHPPRPLAWLHVPKCGTSFANVLFSHTAICPTMPPTAYMRPGDHWSTFTKKYKLDKYCRGSFEQNFQGDHYGIGPDYWRIGGGHVFAFFRQPEQRIISGFLDKQKDYPKRWEPREEVTVARYAKEMAGCATRMMTRGFMPCGDLFGGAVTEGETEVALQRVPDLRFVGLTDEWDLSVCLWYRMFGGNCTDLAFLNMRPGKFRNGANARLNASTGLYNVSQYLGTWTDSFDGPLYEKAKEVFWHRVMQYGVNRSSCARTCAAANQTKPFDIEKEGEGMVLSEEEDDSAFEYRWPGRRTYIED